MLSEIYSARHLLEGTGFYCLAHLAPGGDWKQDGCHHRAETATQADIAVLKLTRSASPAPTDMDSTGPMWFLEGARKRGSNSALTMKLDHGLLMHPCLRVLAGIDSTTSLLHKSTGKATSPPGTSCVPWNENPIRLRMTPCLKSRRTKSKKKSAPDSCRAACQERLLWEEGRLHRIFIKAVQAQCCRVPGTSS